MFDTREDLPGAVEFERINGVKCWIHPSAVGMVSADDYGNEGISIVYFRTGQGGFFIKGEPQEIKRKLGW